MVSTSVYLSSSLLAILDREALARRVSRNRLVNEILWKALGDKEDWRLDFFVELAATLHEDDA